MSLCPKLPNLFWHRKKTSKRAPHQAIAIKIKARHLATTAEIWRGAVLSFDTTLEINRASRRLLTEVLQIPIHPLEEDPPASWMEDVDGYTDLEWCVHNISMGTFETRFYVTKESDPRFDVVLGKKDTERLGNVLDGVT